MIPAWVVVAQIHAFKRGEWTLPTQWIATVVMVGVNVSNVNDVLRCLYKCVGFFLIHRFKPKFC